MVFAQVPIYWMFTAHPLFRLPVFLMGVLGGLQVSRAHSNWETFEDPNLKKHILHVIQPWGCCTSSCCSKSVADDKRTEKISKEQSMNIWRKRVDFSVFLYSGFLAALICTKIGLDVTYLEGGKL